MLQRISFWGWLILITIGLYALYNPIGHLSIVSLWLTDNNLPVAIKVAFTVLFGILLFLLLREVWRNLKGMGLLLLLIPIGLFLWVIYTLVNFDMLNLTLWQWIAQPILAIVITVGFQLPKIRRKITGAVMTDDVDTE